MCLAIPGKVLEIIGDEPFQRTGKIAFAGIEKEASLALLPEAQVGNYVLVHAGFAIAIIDEDRARCTLDALDSLAGLDRVGTPHSIDNTETSKP